jgi:hypothetical protein
MTLTAGPEFKNDAHHMVLWTKQSFEGDLKIDYDYTRLDEETRCVTILYIQATGSGKDPYAADISKWGELRKVPSMRSYFDNMNTYHISYAAFPNSGKERKSYIRGRRYMPHKTGLKGTDLEPDFFPEGLFATGVKHHITVIKKDRDLFMRVENPEQVYYCHMTNRKLPVITEGPHRPAPHVHALGALPGLPDCHFAEGTGQPVKPGDKMVQMSAGTM